MGRRIINPYLDVHEKGDKMFIINPYRFVSGDTPAANEFVTRWSVPAGSFTFPAGNTGTYNAEIKFGDQTDWLPVTAYNDADLTQTLTAGVVDIRVRGTFPWFNINNGAVKTYITDVIQWGDVGFTTMTTSFYGASNLVTLPSGPITGASSIISFIAAFNASGIISIPSDVFSIAINATSFSGVCQDCVSLTSNIPNFSYNTKATTFLNAFSGCINATGNIPDFDSNINVTTFQGCFFNCSSLTGSTPQFGNNTQVTSFVNTFYGSSITSISSTSFTGCTVVTSFQQTFRNCTSIAGSSQELWLNPSGAANYTLTAPDYDSGVPNGVDCYLGCTGLTDYATIPTYWK